MPSFLQKPEKIIGNNLIFRDANEDDATFILKLRTDSKKSKYISKTSSELVDQQLWLRKYKSDYDQIYFIILNLQNEKIGTVRLYDVINSSFCWGSWILKDGVQSSFAIESALLVYHFGLSLGFDRAHFSVNKNNSSVWRFHERFGAIKIAENSDSFIYNISLDAINLSLDKFKKYLPNGFLIRA